jgi:hypothetical protein
MKGKRQYKVESIMLKVVSEFREESLLAVPEGLFSVFVFKSRMQTIAKAGNKVA